MKNTFGSALAVTLFGESHGEEIGVVLDGLAPGIPVDGAAIEKKLLLRRPAGKTGSGRREPDPFRIVSGVFGGKTTGTPLCILIPNRDAKSEEYERTRGLARPGHADYAAYLKYHGFEDYRGAGHASGRLTAPLAAAGAIVEGALKAKGIRIGTHIARLDGICDRSFPEDAEELEGAILSLAEKSFAVLDENAGEAMRRRIEEAAEAGDSVGGVLETAAAGIPGGVGEPWFDGVENALSRALFGIPAVKGIEFGAGFGMADARGSAWNDPFRMRDGKIRTVSNHNGGINGGVTNGMPLLFRLLVKPTPSIPREQKTVDFLKREDAVLAVGGRHDPAILHRACPAVDAVTAMVIYDLLAVRFGIEYFADV